MTPDGDHPSPDGGRRPADAEHQPPGAPSAARPEYGETWVYESIVGALPVLDLSGRTAVAVQFVGFEALVLAMAAVYDLWSAVPAGTAAVAVAASGSVLMQRMGRLIRRVDVPSPYVSLLFGTSIEVVLGLLSFLGLVTFLFVVDPVSGPFGWFGPTADRPLLVALLGERPPAPAVYLLLLVLWDVCYRIGTSWWASVVGAWRSVRYDFDAGTAAQLRAVDRLNVEFALVQLFLVPFVWGHALLVAALVGHVAAVLVVSGVSMALIGR